ncbi:MAG: hypothetical protein VW397_03830 [Candidatus Margulisiibacteriota bacterium]
MHFLSRIPGFNSIRHSSKKRYTNFDEIKTKWHKKFDKIIQSLPKGDDLPTLQLPQFKKKEALAAIELFETLPTNRNFHEDLEILTNIIMGSPIADSDGTNDCFQKLTNELSRIKLSYEQNPKFNGNGSPVLFSDLFENMNNYDNSNLNELLIKLPDSQAKPLTSSNETFTANFNIPVVHPDVISGHKIINKEESERFISGVLDNIKQPSVISDPINLTRLLAIDLGNDQSINSKKYDVSKIKPFILKTLNLENTDKFNEYISHLKVIIGSDLPEATSSSGPIDSNAPIADAKLFYYKSDLSNITESNIELNLKQLLGSAARMVPYAPKHFSIELLKKVHNVLVWVQNNG